MKCCDLNSAFGRIRRATAKLKERWQDVHAHWDDKASQEFEKNFLQALAPQITLAAAAVHQLREVLDQAEKELEDDQVVY
jgi:uncharacterized protein YukE